MLSYYIIKGLIMTPHGSDRVQEPDVTRISEIHRPLSFKNNKQTKTEALTKVTYFRAADCS